MVQLGFFAGWGWLAGGGFGCSVPRIRSELMGAYFSFYLCRCSLVVPRAISSILNIIWRSGPIRLWLLRQALPLASGRLHSHSGRSGSIWHTPIAPSCPLPVARCPLPAAAARHTWHPAPDYYSCPPPASSLHLPLGLPPAAHHTCHPAPNSPSCPPPASCTCN